MEISIEQAQKEYAEAIKKSVKLLTRQDIAFAMLTYTMKKCIEAVEKFVNATSDELYHR